MENILTTVGGQKQEVKSLEAGDIPYVEVTKKDLKYTRLHLTRIYDATDTVKMKDKRGTRDWCTFSFSFFFSKLSQRYGNRF